MGFFKKILYDNSCSALRELFKTCSSAQFHWVEGLQLENVGLFDPFKSLCDGSKSAYLQVTADHDHLTVTYLDSTETNLYQFISNPRRASQKSSDPSLLMSVILTFSMINLL